MNEGESRRGRHVWVGPASLRSWVPSSSTEPGESSLQSPVLKATGRLERRLRCNPLAGAGYTIGPAPAGPGPPWPRELTAPGQPCASRRGSGQGATVCRPARRRWNSAGTNEFHPEWLLRQGCPWDFRASGRGFVFKKLTSKFSIWSCWESLIHARKERTVRLKK